MIGNLRFLTSEIRPLTSTASLLKKWILLAIATIGLAASALAQSNDSSASRFNGTWKRDDSDDTMTISVNGDNVLITNSSGASGHAKVNGDTIEYAGRVQGDNNEKIQTIGILQLSSDGTSLIKRRETQYPSGTEEETITYSRVSSSSPAPAYTASSTPTPISKPTPTPKPAEPFVGAWRPADDSAKLTVTVNGRNAFLKYSPGPRDSGTIRSGKLECQTVSRGDGTSSTDVFEMSANGRTLIRRRTFQSPNGAELGHETLTYNRAE